MADSRACCPRVYVRVTGYSFTVDFNGYALIMFSGTRIAAGDVEIEARRRTDVLRGWKSRHGDEAPDRKARKSSSR